MTKIPLDVVHQAIKKSNDADWVNSLSDKHELAPAIATNRHATSETLHKIADAWSKADVKHPHFEHLTRAVYRMLGDVEPFHPGQYYDEGPHANDMDGPEHYATHKNLHPRTIKLIDNQLGNVDNKLISALPSGTDQVVYNPLETDRFYTLRDHIFAISDKLEELTKKSRVVSVSFD